MSFLIALVAFACLAGGTYRQAQLLFGPRATPRRRLLLLGVGYGLLILSLAFAITGADRGRGFVQWFGEITLTALCVILLVWAYGRRR